MSIKSIWIIESDVFKYRVLVKLCKSADIRAWYICEWTIVN